MIEMLDRLLYSLHSSHEGAILIESTHLDERVAFAL